MATKKKGKASNLTIHMPGTYGKWNATTNVSTVAELPAAFAQTNLPLNGWEVPDSSAGGNLQTGTTGGFMAGQGGRIDNQLRFMDEELFIPTNVAESHVGLLEPWAVEDSAGSPAVIGYWPQTWSTVPHAKEVVIISTDKRMLDGWQTFGSGRPINNPLYSMFYLNTYPGEQPITTTRSGVPGSPLVGDHAPALGKILYARVRSYQGGNANAGFQQTGQATWGGASVLASESLYWMRAIHLIGTPNLGTGTGVEKLYFKIPDLNFSITGVNADEGDLSFIMGLRQNLGSN